jgi:hypothetical protein
MPFARKYLDLRKMLRPNNEISGWDNFLNLIKSQLNKPNGLIISSNVSLREFLQDLTIVSHNMAFNESISASDINPDYIRRNYKVDWNISIDHRLTFFSSVYGLHLGTETICGEIRQNHQGK